MAFFKKSSTIVDQKIVSMDWGSVGRYVNEETFVALAVACCRELKLDFRHLEEQGASTVPKSR